MALELVIVVDLGSRFEKCKLIDAELILVGEINDFGRCLNHGDGRC